MEWMPSLPWAASGTNSEAVRCTWRANRSHYLLDLSTIVSWILIERELAAALIFAIAVSLTAFGLPGMVIPLSVLSSPALGPLASAIVIVAGLTVGSQVMFLFVRRVGRERIRSLGGARFENLVLECDKRGMFYSVGLRALGTPHVLVTGASAVTSMSPLTFAIATVAGFAPVVVLSTHLPELL